MKANLIDLGGRLKKLRNRKNLSQEQLAERAEVARSSISSYEQNLTVPSAEIVVTLCTILEASSDYLLGLDLIPKMSLEGLTSRQTDILSEMASAFRAKNDK